MDIIPSELIGCTYVITRKRFSFEDNLILLRRWAIEARHEQVQIGRQRSHHCDFTSQGANDGRHKLCCSFVRLHELREVRIFVRGEVRRHPLGCPCAQVLVQVLSRGLGLEAQRVTAEVCALL